MLAIVALGIGAGLVSALLLGTIAAGTMVGLLLFWLAPLPVILAGLGWHWLLAALAALSAGIALSEALSAKVALAYMAMIGIPSTLLTGLALRPAAPGSAMLNDNTPQGSLPDDGFMRPGGLLLSICLYATVAVVVGAMLIDPSLVSLQARLARSTELLLRLQFDIAADAPLRIPNGGQDLSELPHLYALLAPAFAAVTMVMTLVLSLWLGGLIARASGRLARPWPRLDQTRLPNGAIAPLALALILTQMDGYIGLAGSVLTTLLVIAFALQGFSAIHALSRGLTFRGPLLLAIWLSAMLIGLPVLLIAGFGLLDHFLDLRRRFPRPGGPN